MTDQESRDGAVVAVARFLERTVGGLCRRGVDQWKKLGSGDKIAVAFGLWLTAAFAPVLIYIVHKFIFWVWLAVFTSATPFADWREERRIRANEENARAYQATECIVKWRLKLRDAK